MTEQEKAASQEWLCHGSASLRAGGMTEMANSLRVAPPWADATFCHPERSSPIFSFAPQLGASGCVVEGPGQRLRLNLDFNGRNKLAEHQCRKSSLRSRNFGFMDRIKASFFSRRQLLICFSRRIADLGWPCGSSYTRRVTSYCFVNPSTSFCLCSRTRRSKKLVMRV